MGVRLFVSFIHALGRLAKNLKVAKNSVLERVRNRDSFPSGGRIFMYSSNTFEDVFDVRSLRFHSGTASRRTASRINGLRER
jgi:hypothetical protein